MLDFYDNFPCSLIMGESYVALVKDFSENTTVHGPKNIASAVRFWAKLLWLLLFLMMCGAFFYQGVALVVEYFHYPGKNFNAIL